jgi:hypothetical protein
MPWANSILRCATLSKKVQQALMATLTVAPLIMGGPLAAFAVVKPRARTPLRIIQ